MKLVVKVSLLVVGASAFAFIAGELLGLVRADGGGDQIVTLNFTDAADIKRIRYAPAHSAESSAILADAFACNDQTAIYSQTGGPELLTTTSISSRTHDVTIRQQWSSDTTGLTKRRTSYGQTFSHVVFDVQFQNGSSKQYVIDLPEYCREKSVNIPTPSF